MARIKVWSGTAGAAALLAVSGVAASSPAQAADGAPANSTEAGEREGITKCKAAWNVHRFLFYYDTASEGFP